MKGSFWKIHFLALLLGFCEALVVRPTLYNLLVDVNKTALIREVIEMLLMKQDVKSLLRLGCCAYFNFLPLMSTDPEVLGPYIQLLRQKKCSREVEERFYDLNELQLIELNRHFLMKIGVNFARKGWTSYRFTREEARRIIKDIQNAPSSQIEFLDASELLYAVQYNDQSNFFGLNESWKLFSIPSFLVGYPDTIKLLLWLDQVKAQIRHDDLLFYRLAYLAWYYQSNKVEFANIARELLQKVNVGKFRGLVLNHYSQKQGTILKPLIEIPHDVLDDNQIAKATLCFEHFLAGLQMQYIVPPDQISKLFQRFPPSIVQPFVCRELLERLGYHEFVLVMKGFPPEWESLYYNTRREYSYFPKKLLPTAIQLGLWRYHKFRIEDWEVKGQPILYLNHPNSWQKYIGEEYLGLEKAIALERDGFTFIDCFAETKSIREFIIGRIVEFLLFDKPLPKFTPLLQKCEAIDKGETNEWLPKTLCMKKKTDKYHPTANMARKLLKAIIRAFNEWDTPLHLFMTIDQRSK